MGTPIEPNKSWFRRSQKKTIQAIRYRESHTIDRGTYAHVEVRKALEELFYLKCVYCEIDLSRIDWDVEHFRPKGRVQERPDHPGYYWLVYTWTNLYASCKFCNQKRRVRARWERPGGSTTFGKANEFPLLLEKTRAMGPKDDLGKEKRLLLDPCKDYPQKHLAYDPAGHIYNFRNSKKGDKSIEVFNLDETRLRDKRGEYIGIVIHLLEIVVALKRKGQQREAQKLENIIEDDYCADKCQFAGATRFVVKNPENFGVEI